MSNPNPEVFARTVLTELARLRAETFATRLRLNQLMLWMHYPQSIDQMQDEDQSHIDYFQMASLSKSLTECGLSPDPTPPDTHD